MRKFAFVMVTNFIFASCAFGQTPCPTISVMGPSGLNDFGTFTVNLSKESENYKIEYFWTVSGGKIDEGQGTKIIKVLQNDIGEVITATVEIKGLPKSCPNNGSASVNMIICSLPHSSIKIDEFSEKPPRIHKEILLNLAYSLKAEPPAKAYILEKFKNGTSRDSIKRRLLNTFSYLTKILGISADRITWQISYGDENLTEFWLIPNGADSPEIRETRTEIKGEDFQNQIDKLFPQTYKKSFKPSRKNN